MEEIVEKTSPGAFEEVTRTASIIKKRTRTTPEQLQVLEETFSVNPNPTTVIREILSKQLNMTERGVQIWFQNRRAKQKTLMKKRLSVGEVGFTTVSSSTSSFGSSFPSASLNNTVANPAALGGDSLSLMNEQSLATSLGSTVSTSFDTTLQNILSSTASCLNLPCNILSIGTWRRMSMKPGDLQCLADLPLQLFRWELVEQQNFFRLLISFHAVKSMIFEQTTPFLGKLTIGFSSEPSFEMKSPHHDVWIPCHDFTESQQGSTVFEHVITGNFFGLYKDLKTLIRLEPSLASLVIFNIQDASNPMWSRRGSLPVLSTQTAQSDMLSSSLTNSSLGARMWMKRRSSVFGGDSSPSVSFSPQILQIGLNPPMNALLENQALLNSIHNTPLLGNDLSPLITPFQSHFISNSFALADSPRMSPLNDGASTQVDPSLLTPEMPAMMLDPILAPSRFPVDDMFNFDELQPTQESLDTYLKLEECEQNAGLMDGTELFEQLSGPF